MPTSRPPGRSDRARSLLPGLMFGAVDDSRKTVGDYVRALAAHQIEGEWATLVSLVTIKESYFFRAPQQFDAILKSALPVLLRARAATRHLRIWSAACARGEEPATLAMLLADEPALAGWTWTIVATDLDDEALAGARLGLYGERAVAQVPPELLARWFTRRGKLFELDAALRSRISYQSLNLAHAPFALPFPECDLVLMRNVLIYFRRPLQRWVVSQVGRLLAPEGYLFLGASESVLLLESGGLAPDPATQSLYAGEVADERLHSPLDRYRQRHGHLLGMTWDDGSDYSEPGMVKASASCRAPAMVQKDRPWPLARLPHRGRASRGRRRRAVPSTRTRGSSFARTSPSCRTDTRRSTASSSARTPSASCPSWTGTRC